MKNSTFESISKIIFNSRIRFIIPVLLIGVSKLCASLWVYSKSLQNGTLHLPQMDVLGPMEPQALYLFSAWDTGWYVTNARIYTFERTFFPAYPFLIRFLNYIDNNYWLSAFLISIIFGFVSLPIFQAIAERYMSKSEALGSTLVMSFFPYVFLFTTVAYSESLFMFAVLAAWYFFLKDKIILSSLCSLLATLTKTYGILIVLPIFLGLLVQRKFKKALLTLVSPLLLLIILTIFLPQNLPERLVMEMNAATWAVTRESLGFFWIRDYLFPFFTSSRPMVFFHTFHAFVLAFIVFTGYVIVNTLKIDWKLGFYSVSMFAVIVLFGFVNGIPRYISFIFPIWLVLKTKNLIALVIILSLFYLHSIILWYEFLWSMYPI